MLQNYVKIALRNLRTHRTYTLLNIIGLSVGMAGGLLIFLFIRHHLSTDRYHTNFDRIVRISTDLHLDDESVEYYPEAPLPMAKVLRTDFPQVEQAAFLRMFRELTVSVNQPREGTSRRFLERSGAGLAEPQWFDVLSYVWLRGNPETALRQPNSVVLTESWARKYFGDKDPIGQTLLLNNKVSATVTGLLAEPFTTTDTKLGLFVSMATLHQLDPDYDQANWRQLNSTNRLYVTLKSPRDVASLQEAMPALTRKYYGPEAKYYRFVVQPMREIHFDVARIGGSIRPSLLWSLGTVGVLLLLAASINFVNLATAQALRRVREVGIRKTLGSNREQLIGQFLLETGLITTAATGLSVLVTVVILPLFVNWVELPLALHPDGMTIGFIGGLLVGVTLLAGAYPAFVLSGVTPVSVFRGKSGVSGGRTIRVRQVLVVVQFAVCQALILGALVVAQQVRYMQRADLGFRKDNIVAVTMPFGTKPLQDAFKQTLQAYSGVQAVSLSLLLPTNGLMYGGQVKFDGKPDWERYPVRERLADADFVKTYGLTVIAGRNLAPSDTIREYLINETLLHKLGFQKPEQVVGKRLQYHLSSVPLPIVGVVRDFHLKSLREQIDPCLIASRADAYVRAGILLSDRNPIQTLEYIRQAWLKLYPNEVFEYQFLDEQVASFYKTETLTARLVNAITGIAILICCLGLYGLVTFTVGQRTKEIGIRKVLGASVSSIVALLSRDFVKLVLVAIIIASPLAWYAINQWLRGFVYKTDIGWWVFALAGLLAVGIALITVSFQSVKAALMDPVKSLRIE